MSRVVIETPCTLANLAAEKLKVGDVVEATPAMLTAITAAGGTTRSANTTNLRDTLGTAFGRCSNSSP